MDLDPGPVGGEQVNGHAPLLPDQDGLVAVGGQGGLHEMVPRMARLRGHQQQPARRLARLHAPRARPAVKEAGTELAAGVQVALDLAEPAGNAAGIGAGRPQVVDAGVVPVLHAHDALAVCRAQPAQDAGARRCAAGHEVLLRSRFPRATSVCRASSRCSHRAQPLVNLGQRRGAEAVHPSLRLLADVHQPGLPQHPQVPRHARPGNGQQGRQLARGGRAAGQGLEHCPPALVGQCPQDGFHGLNVPSQLRNGQGT
jgi:hypothetical protein